MVDPHIFVHFVATTYLRRNEFTNCLHELIGGSLGWI